VTATIRVAAAGDIHAGEVLRERIERIERTFSEIGRETDLVLLAGDLTTHGLPEQAAVLADACRPVHIPIVAVLGNHDYSGFSEEISDELESAGLRALRDL